MSAALCVFYDLRPTQRGACSLTKTLSYLLMCVRFTLSLIAFGLEVERKTLGLLVNEARMENQEEGVWAAQKGFGCKR